MNNNAPVALFTPSSENFLLSAKVTVEFKYTYDAGVIFLYVNDDTWAKLCFEYSPQNEAMVVSVVTRGRSDDCNSTVIGSHTVYLRAFRQGNALAYPLLDRWPYLAFCAPLHHRGFRATCRSVLRRSPPPEKAARSISPKSISITEAYPIFVMGPASQKKAKRKSGAKVVL